MRHRPVSSARTSVRMFDNNVLEALSKVPYYLPLVVFIPVTLYFIWRAFTAGVGVGPFIGLFVLGLLIWTATEYVFHRYVFHWLPPGKIGARLHFIFHGVHHDYPNDSMRLVLPPSVSVPLALLFYWLFSLLFPAPSLYAAFAGFILGYIAYDETHYALHHVAFKHPLMRVLKRNHMQHHFVDPSKDYGVTSPLWDWIIGSRRKASPSA